MKKRIANGECPFCDEFFDATTNNVIDMAGDDSAQWRMWMNPFPHKGTDMHVIMTPVRHIEHISQMTSGDWDALGQLCRTLTSRIQLEGGALAMRFGDPKRHAGSIYHLHTNLIVPDMTKELHVMLVKGKEAHEKVEKRLNMFEKLFEIGFSVEDAQNRKKVGEAIDQRHFSTAEFYLIEHCIE